ncbi:type I restriction endonuclease subunit R [uncultured Bacteroides sp.]|uniref:type I restriction endonuclease subunit R n=1 Tax=uncultured Bacteroides sp. TaxID=162156 RepID=UPI0025CF5F31|nr:type I restriction endonuclease subunit R [uncultured Bacteroides sp.]
MKFNQYTWDLYKQSPEGQKAIKEFEEAGNNDTAMDLVFKYNPRIKLWLDNDKARTLIADFCESMWCYNIKEFPDKERPKNLDEAKEYFEEVISRGYQEDGEIVIPRNDYNTMLNNIVWISFLMYYFSPNFYFPNIFVFRFFNLQKIADAFDIELSPVPKKPDYKARCMYYWRLCEIFYQFRIDNSLSPAELCAFLYDFAPNFTPKEKAEIPKPAQAWCIGGMISSEEKKIDTTFWQANPETKKGDILIHYETSPVSAITCFWIAQTDGVIDPFFHYYGNTYIGNKIDIPHITLKELQADDYFSKHPLIRKKFQGVNGWPMSSEDYSELLRMIKAKGFDIDTLPKLYAPTLPKNVNIEIERDVEQQLLEPLLNSMEWYENKDFIRQLPIHAGRGHRIFPDYALHYDNKPDEEKAKVLIEAKLYMKNNQEIEKAFLQARSYAYLLESTVIVLCDKQCLIVYEKKQSFDRDSYKKYYWGELENPDLFNELKNKLNI